jgi:hypothetical protein
MKNVCLAVALRELELAGIRNIEQARGGKHLQLRWSVNGHAQRVYTMPLTPGDTVHGPRNTRAGIRRMLREDGVLQQIKTRPLTKPPDRLAMIEQRMTTLERVVVKLQEQVRAIMEGNNAS